ncbi:hypothetical protein BV22DRAFT_714341 [Leucogyrophana mollusca]|uniref:Uncharacterized protein n=1 Tax=Leucogyrophana mollusca TaxID=85980 RepID=A0ACB8B8M4_9AGAM|nr:hypothetical protein BV22DRAFT_714341 [Leucogyrophana mollusca]
MISNRSASLAYWSRTKRPYGLNRNRRDIHMLLPAAFTRAGKTRRKNRSTSSACLNDVSRIKLQSIFKSLRARRKAATSRPLSGDSSSRRPLPRSVPNNRNRSHMRRPLLTGGLGGSYATLPSSSALERSEDSPSTLYRVNMDVSSFQLTSPAPHFSPPANRVLPSSPSVFALRTDFRGDYLIAQLGKNLERMSLNDDRRVHVDPYATQGIIKPHRAEYTAIPPIRDDQSTFELQRDTSIEMGKDDDPVRSPDTHYTWLDAPTIIITSAESESKYPRLLRSSAIKGFVDITNSSVPELSDDPFTFTYAPPCVSLSYSLPPPPSPGDLSASSLDWNAPETPSPCYFQPEDLEALSHPPLDPLLADVFMLPRFSLPPLEARLFVSSST